MNEDEFFEDITATEWYNLGVEFSNQEDHLKAKYAFDQAIKINTDYTEAYYKRGFAHFYLGDIKESTNDYKKVIELDESFLAALMLIGKNYDFLGKFDVAILYYNRLLEKVPNHIDTLFFRALCYNEMGNYKMALKDLDQIINLNDEIATAYEWRGIVLHNMNLNKKALKDFDKSIFLDHKNHSSYFWRGVAYSALNNYDESIINLNVAIEKNPLDEKAFSWKGKIQAKLGQYEQAIESYNRAVLIIETLNAKPLFSSTYLERSLVWMSLGRMHDALLDFNCYAANSKQLNNRFSPSRFENISLIISFNKIITTPFLTWQLFQSFFNLETLYLINPVIDEVRQISRHMRYFLHFLRLKEEEKNNKLIYYHTEALINFYMGDPISAYNIYDQIIDTEMLGINLMGQYYFIESAKLIREPYESILEFALVQIEQKTSELINNGDLTELYYAGQILYSCDKTIEALNYFSESDKYLPSAIMHLYIMQQLDGQNKDIERKRIEVQNRDISEKGMLNGFTPKALDISCKNYFQNIHDYAIYKEIQDAIKEVRDVKNVFRHNEMWSAFYWNIGDLDTIEMLDRQAEISSIIKEVEKKFGAKFDNRLQSTDIDIIPEFEHPKRYFIFKNIRRAVSEGEDIEQIISSHIYGQSEDFETYTLLIRFFYGFDKAMTVQTAVILQSYNIYFNRFYNFKTDAIEEGFVEGIQPVIGTIIGGLMGDLSGAIIGGALSVVFKNVIKKIVLNEKKLVYNQFKEHYLENFSYLRETMKPTDFDKYFGFIT